MCKTSQLALKRLLHIRSTSKFSKARNISTSSLTNTYFFLKPHITSTKEVKKLQIPKYERSNSRNNLKAVNKELKSQESPDLMRNVWISNNTELSEATTLKHLKQLQNKGKVQRFDQFYVHRETVKRLTMNQLNKLKKHLTSKQNDVWNLKQRLEKKIESKKEFLRNDGHELLSEREFDREVKQITRLEGRKNHLEKRYEHIRDRIEKLYLYSERKLSKESDHELHGNSISKPKLTV